MDQGPVRPPPRPRWSAADVRDLARAVAIVWGVALLLVVMVTVVWSGVSELSAREAALPSTLIVATTLPLFGFLSRFADASTFGWAGTETVGRRNAMYGDTEVAGLTTIGVFLFVSVPLAVGGTLLLG